MLFSFLGGPFIHADRMISRPLQRKTRPGWRTGKAVARVYKKDTLQQAGEKEGKRGGARDAPRTKDIQPVHFQASRDGEPHTSEESALKPMELLVHRVVYTLWDLHSIGVLIFLPKLRFFSPGPPAQTKQKKKGNNEIEDALPFCGFFPNGVERKC